MSSQINGLNIPVLENKKKVSFGQTPVVLQYPQQTSMQGTPDVAATANNAVSNSYIANRARASQDNNQLAVAGIGAATWYGLSQGMEYVNNKLSTGDYDKTIYGKLGALGDKFCQKTWVGRKLQAGIDGTKAFIEKLSGKSKIVNSLAHHSTRPEWNIVKQASRGPEGFAIGDAENIIKEFYKPIAARDRFSIMGFGFGGKVNLYQKLEQYGMGQNEINAFKDSLKGKPFAEKALALQMKELELLGADKATLDSLKNVNDLSVLQKEAGKLKGNIFNETLKAFKDNEGKYINHPEKVLEMFENASKSKLKFISVWRDNTTWYGRLMSHLFGRKIQPSEYRNKFLVTSGKGNATTLGRMLPKGLAWLLEGGTNRFGGGKLGAVMQAGILADIIYNSVKAKGERIKTFAERCVNDFTYFIGMSVGVMAMHKIGGFKYAGLKDAAEAETYRNAQKLFNKKTVSKKVFHSKKEWKTALKEMEKKYLKYDQIKNPITKLLYKIGRFINTGNESNAYYRSTSKFNMNWLRAIANKNIIGVPVRFLIPMAMITPFLAKMTTTAAHKIFGRPTHSVLDEEEETEVPQEKNPGKEGQPVQGGQNGTPSVNQQQSVQGNTNQQQGAKNPNDYQSDTNLIKMTANGEKPPVRTYIPSPDCEIPEAGRKNQKQTAPERSYIPSPSAAVINDPDMTAANAALADADMTEKYINETMASMK